MRTSVVPAASWVSSSPPSSRDWTGEFAGWPSSADASHDRRLRPRRGSVRGPASRLADPTPTADGLEDVLLALPPVRSPVVSCSGLPYGRCLPPAEPLPFALPPLAFAGERGFLAISPNPTQPGCSAKFSSVPSCRQSTTCSPCMRRSVRSRCGASMFCGVTAEQEGWSMKR